MAFGDLIAALQLPPVQSIQQGYGLTVYHNQLAISSKTPNSDQVSFYDIDNFLAYLSVIDTEETYKSIQYDANEGVYWGLTNDIHNEGQGETLQKVIEFQTNGSTILSFEVHETIPVADRFNPSDWKKETAIAISLTPDGSELWVAFEGAFRIYRFDTTGNYLGYFDISPENHTITGMSTDGTNMWFVTTDLKFSTFLTISKRNIIGDVLETVTRPVPVVGVSGDKVQVGDIEFDAVNFASRCVLWVRGYSANVGNVGHYAFVYEVPCTGQPPCQEPPVIYAENQCLFVGDTFDPLADVTATDCDGSDIPLTQANVIYNDVDTSTPGIYMVTYEVTSLINGQVTTKTIYVGVVEVGPRHQAITDLIESVALEQTGIAHILNAEGKKIQKAKELNLSNEEMLKINKSVNDMIDAIAMLELVLQSKLELFKDDLCGPQCDFPEEENGNH